MKQSNAIRIFSFLFCLILCLPLLAACKEKPSDNPSGDSDTQPSSGTVDFTVHVQNYAKEPINGIVVSVVGEEAVKMTADGTVTFTLMPHKEQFRFTLTSPKVDYSYDESLCVFSTDNREVTVTLYEKPSKPMSLWVPTADGNGTNYSAPGVTEGAFQVPVTANQINYFVFTPKRDGIYRFYVLNRTDAPAGYYGNVFNVQDHSILAPVNGAVELEVRASSIGATLDETAQYVIGITAPAGMTDCILAAERIGDPEKSLIDEPWIDVVPDKDLLKKYPTDYLNWKSVFKPLDLTDAALKVVLNKTDRLYHIGTENGPVVYIKYTVENKYLPSFPDMNYTDPFKCYLFDKDGTFLRKENYASLIDAYAAVCDRNGICPLNEQLAEVIQVYGEKQKWWDFDSDRHIFGSEKVVAENAWLFACGTYEIDRNAYGSEASPIRLTESGSLILGAGETFHFTSGLTESVRITVTAPDGSVELLLNGQAYRPENGSFTVTLTKTGQTFTLQSGSGDPVEVQFSVPQPDPQ